MGSGFVVRPLRSGSSGNVTLVEHGGTVLLLDAGLPSSRALDLALTEGERRWDDVDGLLVSHLHGDHIHPSAVTACARSEIPVFIHEKNLRAFSRRVLSRAPSAGIVRPFAFAPFAIGSIGVRPFQVSHDAEGVTCGFVLTGRNEERELRVTVATDLGHGGNGLFEEFVDSDLILIEANYEPSMLAESRRHDKRRVGSDVGHLSNEQAGRFLARVFLESRRLPKAVVLCHLSADHNTPARAVAAVREILTRYGFGEVAVHAARRHAPSPRFCAVEGRKG